MAVCYTGDLKKYGFRPIIEKFRKDIKILETIGVQIYIPGRREVTIFGSISQFCGDFLVINEIFGLVCDFSHDYHCSMCYCTKDSLNSFFREDNFVQEQKESETTHTRGVKHDSALNDLIFFHTAENMMVDLLAAYLSRKIFFLTRLDRCCMFIKTLKNGLQSPNLMIGFVGLPV